MKTFVYFLVVKCATVYIFLTLLVIDLHVSLLVCYTWKVIIDHKSIAKHLFCLNIFHTFLCYSRSSFQTIIIAKVIQSNDVWSISK